MTIWEECNGLNHLIPLTLEPWRIVEAQHISSSRDLVDTIEEHDLLETLLEETKPFISPQKHYLIFTPFRYPPLKYGSRFGSLDQPSLWYGSLELETAFAEVAYYRRQFLKDTHGALGYIETPVTAFSTYLKTQRGIDLTHIPFDNYHKLISSKENYTYSQSLGTAMRQAHIEAFIYFSARTDNPSKNIAAYTPNVFHMKKNQYIHNQQNWTCIANKNSIEFIRCDILKNQRLIFTIE